jgi:hypothetical protein
MATSDTSDLVRELSARVAAQAPKVRTTISLNGKVFERLKAQEKRWDTSMSYIIERALGPVLDELEQAQLPNANHGADKV